jgi:hypothetical protein
MTDHRQLCFVDAVLWLDESSLGCRRSGTMEKKEDTLLYGAADGW